MTDSARRRLVTGTNANGKAVFVHDDAVEFSPAPGLGDSTGIWKVWGANSRVQLPANGESFDYDTIMPPASGFRYEVMSVGPGATVPLHSSSAVDVGVVLSGEIWLELDDGVEELLRRGDLFVQNGTVHAWHNRGAEPCVLAIVLIGAAPAEPLDPSASPSIAWKERRSQ